jgi:hypothetical protein
LNRLSRQVIDRKAALLQHFDPGISLDNPPIRFDSQRLFLVEPKRLNDFIGWSGPMMFKAPAGVGILFIDRLMNAPQRRLLATHPPPIN